MRRRHRRRPPAPPAPAGSPGPRLLSPPCSAAQAGQVLSAIVELDEEWLGVEIPFQRRGEIVALAQAGVDQPRDRHFALEVTEVGRVVGELEHPQSVSLLMPGQPHLIGPRAAQRTLQPPLRAARRGLARHQRQLAGRRGLGDTHLHRRGQPIADPGRAVVSRLWSSSFSALRSLEIAVVSEPSTTIVAGHTASISSPLVSTSPGWRSSSRSSSSGLISSSTISRRERSAASGSRPVHSRRSATRGGRFRGLPTSSDAISPVPQTSRHPRAR